MKKGRGLAIRGRFVDVRAVAESPAEIAEQSRYLDDGLLLVENGLIQWFGRWQDGKNRVPAHYALHDHQQQQKIIMPGFVDTHVHFPQAEIIGSHGKQLLDWLNKYAFPAEIRYGDRAYGEKMAGFFLDQLLQNGTTTALVFCTVHKASVEALFGAATARHMRLIGGKVLMDRNAPTALLDTAKTGYDQSRELIKQYHNTGRLHYAVTPRFALTSTEEQLELAGQLKKEFADVYVQTHLSENRAEIEQVHQLFPGCGNYLDVYHQSGLTGRRSIFAHCIHLREDEWQGLKTSGSAIAFCPTSNLFLGSGLFDLERARSEGIEVGMATDVGGGTSLNMLQTLAEAYKVAQLQGQQFSPWEALYRATLGGARALSLDGQIGSFTPGKEADFVVLDPEATPLLAMRNARAESIEEQLFALIILGDDRSISHTYVDGRLVYERDK